MDYPDANGIMFDAHRAYLSADRREWGHPPTVYDDSVKNRWRQYWVGRPCWWCEQSTHYGGVRGELHHMARTDIPFAFSWLCVDCHQHHGTAVTSNAFGRLLYLKWKYDRKNTVWIPLAVKSGQHLPDLEP